MLESHKETMESDLEIREFVDAHKGKKVTADNVDEFVLPEERDEVSTRLLRLLAKERATETTLEAMKQDFRKKRMDLDTYLRVTREIGEKQFMTISKRMKVTNFIEVNGGGRR